MERLLSAPSDLPQVAPRQNAARERQEAHPSYDALFLRYRRDLETALAVAEPWWAGVVKRSSPGWFSRRKTAIQRAYDRFFAGGAGHPVVQGVLHDYWLECVELADTLEAPLQLPPETVLLRWLLDGRHDSWVRCLTALPHWPIGLDADGHWE